MRKVKIEFTYEGRKPNIFEMKKSIEKHCGEIKDFLIVDLKEESSCLKQPEKEQP